MKKLLLFTFATAVSLGFIVHVNGKNLKHKINEVDTIRTVAGTPLSYSSSSSTNCTTKDCLKNYLSVIDQNTNSSYSLLYRKDQNTWVLYKHPDKRLLSKISVKRLSILKGDIGIADKQYPDIHTLVVIE